MGTARFSHYFIRVRAPLGGVGSFTLRATADGGSGAPASGTPTPSPSLAPLTPATVFTAPWPLALDAKPVFDALARGAARSWTYIHNSNAPFTVVASPSSGCPSGTCSGDVALRLCGETNCELDSDGSWASSTEARSTGPGSRSWGGIGAAYTITIFSRFDKESSPVSTARYALWVVPGIAAVPPATSATSTPAPASLVSYDLFCDTTVTETRLRRRCHVLDHPRGWRR
jgi:hypothetical protein